MWSLVNFRSCLALISSPKRVALLNVSWSIRNQSDMESTLAKRIHHNRRELDNISRELLDIHLRLASVLSKSEWSLIDQLTFKKATRLGEDSKARQLRKFTRLHKTQHPTTKTSKETVIKLSGRMLDDGLSSLLQKDPNYAVTPRTITIEDALVGLKRQCSVYLWRWRKKPGKKTRGL